MAVAAKDIRRLKTSVVVFGTTLADRMVATVVNCKNDFCGSRIAR